MSSTLEFTLDDAAPYIQYSGSWSTNHSGDPYLTSYFDSTFHATYTQGDTATIIFNGTGITVYGGKRPNHGNYTVSLNDGPAVTNNGASAQNSFQQPIYTGTNLDASTQHKLVFTNQMAIGGTASNPDANQWFDLDFAVITQELSKPLQPTRRVDNTLSGWTYNNFETPGPNSQPIDPTAYYNSSAQITGDVGATATYVWNGSSIAIFGGLYHDHGEFNVSLDGIESGPYNGTYIGEFSDNITTQQALFFASSLNDGPHSITLTNLGGPNGNFLDIDYAESNSTIYGNTTSSDGGSSTTDSSSANGSSSAHHSNTGAIAGGVVGGVLGALLIAGLVFFFVRRSKRDRPKDYGRGRGNELDLAGEEPKFSEPLATPYYANGQGPPSNQWGGSSQGYSAYQTNVDRSVGGSPLVSTTSPPGLAHVPPPPASSATSYPASHAGGPERTALAGIAASQSGSSSGPSSSSGQLTGYGSPTPLAAPWGGQAHGQPGAMPGTQKSMGVGLPYTAQAPHAASPPPLNREDSAAMQQRLAREGREGDAGPFQAHHEDGTLLPPDYEQATEPLPGQRPQ